MFRRRIRSAFLENGSMPARLATLVILLVAVALMTAGSGGVRAAENGGAAFRARVDALAKGSYSRKAKAVQALAETGDPRAAGILRDYRSGRIYRRDSDGRVFVWKSESGDSVTLADPLAPSKTVTLKSADVTKARINNHVRSAVGSALAALNLFSKNVETRKAAADAAFKVRSKSFLPLLKKALAVEKDSETRAHLRRAHAATVIAHGSNAAERIAAIKQLASESTPAIVALLKPLTAKDANGKFLEPDPAVRAAAVGAVKGIESNLALWSTAGDLYRGISLGSVLLLAAIGLAVTFGVMGVINMAHGEMVVIGAYATFTVQEIFRTSAPELFDYSLAVALPVAFVAAGAIGIALERGIIRFLYGRPLETLLATWGVSLIIQQAVRTIYGAQNREVGNPSFMSGGFDVAGGITLTYNRLWIIVFALIVFGALVLIVRKTSLGLKMRAVTQNRPMASAMGIRNGWVNAMTFGLGSGIAGVAGVALSQITNVSPNLGQSFIIDSFMVVVFGGVGNLWGTLVGALSLGVINKLLEPYAGAVLGKVLMLVFIILFIQRRPRGLFALKGRAAEG
jgi:urea transport system permease protein